MATAQCFHDAPECMTWTNKFIGNIAEQNDEVLALESIYEADGEERFQIINRPNQETDLLKEEDGGNSGLYSLQFQIPLGIGGESTQIDICIPEAEEPVDDSNKNVLFKRSHSGRRLLGSMTVSYLTPLRLVVVLPPGYPSVDPPIFTLWNEWLRHEQLCCLCKQLDELWKETSFLPILYTWVDWLENNAKSSLGITNHIFLEQQMEEEEIIDDRANSECYDVIKTADVLSRFSLEQEAIQFPKEPHECCVCFMERPGNEFIRLNGCGHFFCVDCATDFCKHHIQEGTVLDLLCPESKCDCEIPPYIIQSLIGEKEFKRFERMALNKALDKMGDVVWCPRCHQPVIKDNTTDMNHGQCAACYFSFCTICMENWHQGTGCYKYESDSEEEVNDNSEAEEVETKLQRKQRYEMLKRNEIQSRKFVMQTCKQCPSCKMDIIKDGGCNLVNCLYCRAKMCWICGRNITACGYSHFSDYDNCRLMTYDGMLNIQPRFVPRNHRPVNVQVAEAQLPVNRENRFRCPSCKQWNLRKNRNNHIKCWACGKNSCFSCKSIIHDVPILKHFIGNNPCRQHSPN